MLMTMTIWWGRNLDKDYNDENGWQVIWRIQMMLITISIPDNSMMIPRHSMYLQTQRKWKSCQMILIGPVWRVTIFMMMTNEVGDDEWKEGDEDEEPVKKESFRRKAELSTRQFWGKHPTYRRQCHLHFPARKKRIKKYSCQWDDSSVENETPYGSDNQEYKAPFSVRT